MIAYDLSLPGTNKPLLSRIFGFALSALGIAVMAGSILIYLGVTTLNYGLVTMRFNAALCFVLIGLLFLNHSLQPSRFRFWVNNFLSFALIILPGLVLIELLFHVDLNIDWDSLYPSVTKIIPQPGRMSVMSCITLMLAGFGFIGLGSARHRWQVVAFIITPAILIILFSASSFVESILGLEEVYHFAQYSLMSEATSSGLIATGVGFIALSAPSLQGLFFEKDRYDKYITRVSASLIFALTLAIGLSSFVLLKESADKSLQFSMQQSARATAEHFSESLTNSMDFVAYLAKTDDLQAKMKKAQQGALSDDARKSLAEIAQSLMQSGFSNVVIRDKLGVTLAGAGTRVVNPVQSADITLNDKKGRLMWDNGFVLHLEHKIVSKGEDLGLLITEQPLKELTRFFDDTRQMGESILTIFCAQVSADMMACFPVRQMPIPGLLPLKDKSLPRYPMSYALAGETGVRYMHDLNNKSIMAAYTPVANSNMGIVVKIDAFELFNRFRVYMQVLLGVIFILVVVGTFVLRSQVQPITRRLVQSEAEARRNNVLLTRDAERLNQVIAAQEQIAQPGFNLDKVLDNIVERLQTLTNAAGVVVELLDGDELVCRAASGSMQTSRGLRFAAESGLSGVSVDSQEILVCRDAEIDPRVDKSSTRNLNMRSLIVAPLIYQGKALGVLKVMSPEPDAFSDTEKQSVQLLSGLIATAITRQRGADAMKMLLSEKSDAVVSLEEAKKKLSHLAQYDQLTGLPNRMLFMDRMLTAVLRSDRLRRAMALMFLDLDGFKEINDGFGHQVGDQVLKEFSDRLKNLLRKTDTVARLGGDEFTVIVEEMANPEADVRMLADKIIKEMATPLDIGGHQLTLSVSIGIYLHKSGIGNLEDLLRFADMEMYKAKKSGKNRYSIREQ